TSSAYAASRSHHPESRPKAAAMTPASASSASAPIAAQGRAGAKLIPNSVTWSLAEPAQHFGGVHLVGFVVAGQRIDDRVDAKAEGKLALALSGTPDVEKRQRVLIHRPGRGPIGRADNDRRDRIIHAVELRDIGRGWLGALAHWWWGFDPDAPAPP